ncbi:MAG: hypothetical protein QME73_14140 [Bacillota bacterium]|nr:hypothetical protein [Bacillota bacterium]
MAWWAVAALLIAAYDAGSRLKKNGRLWLRRNIWKARRDGILRFVTPKPGSRAYEKQKKLIQRARVDITVEGLQALVIAGLVLGLLAGAAVVHTNVRMRVREAYLSRSSNVLTFIKPGTGGGDERKDLLLERLTAEAAGSIDYKGYIERGEYRELKRKVLSMVEQTGVVDEYAGEYAEKVYRSLLELKDAGFGRNDALILIMLGCTGMLVPGWVLGVRAKKTLGMMEYELSRLEIITILLLQRENINISSILMRLKAASNVYRPYLSRCLAAYPENPHGAMTRLQEEVDYPPFTDFINVLKQGIDSDRETTGKVLDMTRRLKNALQEAMEKQNIRKAHRNIQLLQYPMVAALLAVLLLPWLIIFKNNL